MGRVTREAAPPTPPRADLERIWPYVPGRHRTEIVRAYGVTDVLKLASNENLLGPSPKAVAALTGIAGEVHSYPDSRAHDLRRALAARHRVDPTRIVVGAGSVECIDLVARAFLRPGDGAVIGFPSFPRYAIACQVVGLAPTVVPHVGWRLDLDGMLAAVDERTRVVFLDDPCNPTGTMVEAADLAGFMDRLPPEVLVVLDRAYHEFIDPDERFDEGVERIEAGANLIVLRTFSKAYGLAGLRVGYAIARPEHARAMDRVREAFNASVAAQTAALAALDDDAHVAATVGTTNAERGWLAGELARLGIRTLPSATNFVFAEFGERAPAIHEGLHRRGIVLRPMSAPGIERWARITIPTRPGGERLVAALDELLA